MARSAYILTLFVLALSACQRTDPTGATPSATASLGAPLTPSAAPAPSSDAGPATSAISREDFSRLFREASEPDRYFFSDNYVSNETSYLEVIPELRTRARKHGGYIGVGPEQNFSYIAEAEPELSFIVDIRRGNAIEQLLYKALFEEAQSRAHFLALLVGRPGGDHAAPAPDASLDEIFAFVDKLNKDPAEYSKIHSLLVSKIKRYGIALSSDDEKTLEATHHAFFDKGLDLSFELLEKNGRKYPTLRELLRTKDPNGEESGFMGTDTRFKNVQRLERENRIIPVVGDFAGDHALATIAAELKRRDLPVSAFYVSNVEQYLMDPTKWPAWVKNIDALPSNESSLFIRCYLDQGRRHPAEPKGQRTATVLQLFDHFKWRQRTRSYKSFFELSTDGMLAPDAGKD